MQHPEEGTIHAWLDGALPADEAARVEEHVKTCAECAALVAEARGLIAASSRIVSALDVVPGGVIPAFGGRPRRHWSTRWIGSAIAATLVVAAGTMLSIKGRVVEKQPMGAMAVDSSSATELNAGVDRLTPTRPSADVATQSSAHSAPLRDTAAVPRGNRKRLATRQDVQELPSRSPTIGPLADSRMMSSSQMPGAPTNASVKPSIVTPAVPTFDAATASATRARASSVPTNAASKAGQAPIVSTNTVSKAQTPIVPTNTASKAAQAPTVPTNTVSKAQTPTVVPTNIVSKAAPAANRDSVVSRADSVVARPTTAGVAGGMAAAPAERRAAAQQRGMTADIVLEAPLAGCYDANESTDILPKRFALAADGEVRYVDSTGVVDGKIADATWMEVNGRAVIRTVTRGQVLTVWRQGSVLRANSPLGNRSVRILACR